MTAVEAILQVYDGLSDQIVSAYKVPVIDLNREARLHREGRLDLKASGIMHNMWNL